MSNHSKLIASMIEYYAGDPRRISHFLKVHSFAKAIGELESIDQNELYILEAAAIVHDIGIKPSEEKYGSSSGKYQEQEGPPAAKPMLCALDYPEKAVDRICYLIAHHHTYSDIIGIDYQILVEADFLVNIYEDGLATDVADNICNKLFKTKTGRSFLKQMFLI